MATRGTPLPCELRNAIAKFLADGHSLTGAARAVGVARNTVRKYRVHRIMRRPATDGGLSEIISAWPHLAESVRAELLAIVRS